jgi:predicted small lipoprotein YifL
VIRPSTNLGELMVIDCDACAARGPACGDCVVSVLLGGPPVQGREGAATSPDARPPAAVPPVDLDGAERAALAVLAGCGLVPPLRLVPAEEPARTPRTEPGEPEREVS